MLRTRTERPGSAPEPTATTGSAGPPGDRTAPCVHALGGARAAGRGAADRQIALPSAQRALHFSTDSRQWIIMAYALACGSLLLFGGKLGDLFLRKWT